MKPEELEFYQKQFALIHEVAKENGNMQMQLICSSLQGAILQGDIAIHLYAMEAVKIVQNMLLPMLQMQKQQAQNRMDDFVSNITLPDDLFPKP